MADNTVLNSGSGGDTIRGIQRTSGGAKTQVMAVDLGGASTNSELLLQGGQSPSAKAIPVVPASDWSDPSLQKMLALQMISLQLQAAGQEGFVPFEIPSIGA